MLIDDVELVGPSEHLVYDEQLRNGFDDWSSVSRDFSQSALTQLGGAAISFIPANWGVLYFHRDSGIDLKEYRAVQF